jgi:hypothetical protein
VVNAAAMTDFPISPSPGLRKEADAAGLAIDRQKYRRLVGASFDEDLPADRALGVSRPNARGVLAG